MGINFTYVDRMDQLGLFGDGRCAILDIGSSNLYQADAGAVARFIRKYRPDHAGLESFAARMAKGSAYDSKTGGINESFAGEVFEAAGMTYHAIDIADGYRTTVLDLNHRTIPIEFQNAFDLVINYGTTEHILNQYNAFRAIHDAAKCGGHIIHQLPSVGFVDHGYFCYTGRFFFDLAAYNKYEIVDFWFDGPHGPENIYQSVRAYKRLFPALGKLLQRIIDDGPEARLDRAQVPTIAINVVFRKTKAMPFMGAIETSTSVGAIPADIIGAYRR